MQLLRRMWEWPALEGTGLVRKEHSSEKTGAACYYWMCRHREFVSKLKKLELPTCLSGWVQGPLFTFWEDAG